MQSARRRVSGARALICFAWVTTGCTAHAQPYPNKPVRIVTTEPGSGNDLVARLIVPWLSASLGQPVVVDNRGILAGEIVAKAPPDAYTLLSYGSPLWLAPFMRERVPYDPVKDFAPITLAASSPNVLIASSPPVNSVRELIAAGRARRAQLFVELDWRHAASRCRTLQGHGRREHRAGHRIQRGGRLPR